MSLHCAAETYIKIKVPGADGAEGKAMSFMYFLAVLIGPLVKILYSFIGNYAATMIVATLILKLLLFPLSIHQQKSTAKMSVFQPLITEIQQKYNADHGIVPQQIRKDIKGALSGFMDSTKSAENAAPKSMSQTRTTSTPYRPYIEPEPAAFAADPVVKRMTRKQLEKSIADTTELMKEAAKNLDFLQAAQYRDEIVRLQEELEGKE